MPIRLAAALLALSMLVGACGDDDGGAEVDFDVSDVIARSFALHLQVPPENIDEDLRATACGENDLEAAIMARGAEGARLLVAVAHVACPDHLATLQASLEQSAAERGEPEAAPAAWIAELDDLFGRGEPAS